MIHRAPSAFALALALVLPIAVASCATGTGSGSSGDVVESDPVVVDACNAACEQFVGGDCYGACKAVCKSPTCTTTGLESGYKNVIALRCDSSSVNFATKTSSSSCSSQDIPAAGDNGTGTARRMFVTSASFTANLAAVGGAATGLAGGDNLCNQAAQASSLGGAWKAWLSASTMDAIDRIDDVGPWLNLSRTSILFPNKAALTQVPLDGIWADLEDDHGSIPTGSAWTGTRTGGHLSQGDGFIDTCDDWADVGQFSLGSTGAVHSNASNWTDYLLGECQIDSNHLYCIEQ
jgi:hypothetical protein